MGAQATLAEKKGRNSRKNEIASHTCASHACVTAKSRKAVALWETGESAISAVQLGRLAALYGVSADFLIFGLRTVPVNNESACSRCENAKTIMQIALRREQA